MWAALVTSTVVSVSGMTVVPQELPLKERKKPEILANSPVFVVPVAALLLPT